MPKLRFLIAAILWAGIAIFMRINTLASPGIDMSGAKIDADAPIREAVARVDPAALVEHVTVMSDAIGIRTAGSVNERRAAEYIASQFRSYGYETTITPFKPSTGQGLSCNVIAHRGTRSGLTIVVGAHMDSVPGSPGANDNASGVAVMLEVARILAEGNLPCDVTYVAFGSEEIGFDGSMHYVARLSRFPDGMANLDMVAVGTEFQIAAPLGEEDWLAHHFRAGASRMGCNPRPDATLMESSDYSSFSNRFVPVSCWVWGPDPNNHKPADVIPVDPSSRDQFTRNLTLTARALIAGLLTMPGKQPTSESHPAPDG